MLSIIWASTTVFHTLKSSWVAKAWLIALSLLSEFSRASIGSLKMMRYYKQETCSNSDSNYLVFQSLTQKQQRPALIFQLFKTLVSIVVFLLTSIALDMAHIFIVLIFIFDFLPNIGGIDQSGWIALTTFMTLVFLEDLGLDVNLTFVSKKIVISSLVILRRLILLVIFNWWLKVSWALDLNFSCL